MTCEKEDKMKDTNQVETIYRAKKTDSDELLKGDKICYQDDCYIVPRDAMYDLFNLTINLDDYMVEEETLAIHFTNSGMEDSEGTPIFASLSRDGNGGDEVDYYYNFIKEVSVIKNGAWNGSIKRKDVSIATGIHTVKEER